MGFRGRELNEKEKLFVDLYCRYEDPYGVQAAKEAENGRLSMQAFFLTRPEVLAAIKAKNGPEPIVVVRPLSVKEHKFLDDYLLTLNARVSADNLGMDYSKCKDYLKKPHFKHELEQRLKDLRHSSLINAEEVLEELALIAFSDITDYCSFKEGKVSIKDSDNVVNTGALSEISEGQYGLKVKLHSKMSALESLGKYLGLFKERVELTGKDGEAIQIESPLDSLTRTLDNLSKNNSTKDSLSIDADEEES